MQKKLIFLLIITSILAACAPTQSPAPVLLPSATSSPPPPTATSTSRPTALWISDSVPDKLREIASDSGIPLTDDANTASMHLHLSEGVNASVWTYALVAPFPTIRDGVSSAELKAAWAGSAPDPWAGSPLWMAESTKMALSAIWGEASSGAVRTASSDNLLDLTWEMENAWAIIPFEEIEPRWKVLTIDGQSPLHNNFVPQNYPLNLSFGVDAPTSLELPALNRDPDKLTTLVMTGVTALVRGTAYTMERKGITYPAQDIGDWLRDADIAHISNEIPFYEYCKPPTPGQVGLQFCSDPRYIELIEFVGADVIELTGNHFQDYGSEATLYTLDMYDERGLPYFGGGRDLEDARKPLKIEHNGNKFAFIGCNPAGPEFALARADGWPGSAPCDPKYMVAQIEALRAEGYLLIATFQYHEYYSPEIRPWQARDYRRLADAGAVVVSGSQGHFAQAKEFYSGAFIDYGLGNLFFDQMDNPVVGTRREFIDRHVFYDGQYLGVELLTALLVDYSRPIPMTDVQRADFLSYIFEASGWRDYPPTPTPSPTMTLTPIGMPVPFATLTPLPYWGGEH
ncbi:MAG: hypothetical protein HN855_15240 [Anaerolineae bacterium]|nr:hypothetical protein [Anaerolineae bacterium]MBT7326510.1 hypothetical protein [Anaerolineae bacterium]